MKKDKNTFKYTGTRVAMDGNTAAIMCERESTDGAGAYLSRSGLPTGSYFVQTFNPGDLLDELYNDIPCIGFCQPTTGTPVPVTVAETTSGIDFALEPGGSIAGNVTNSATGLGVAGVTVQIYDAIGSFVESATTDATGDYETAESLPTGTYFAVTSNAAALIDETGGVAQHPVWRDELTALTATRRLLALARKTGRPVHVLHVTTAEEEPELAAAKDIATMEVTPQHLTLAAPECYEQLGSLAQMNPPIRDARHREALWRAVVDGVVDFVGGGEAAQAEAKGGEGVFVGQAHGTKHVAGFVRARSAGAAGGDGDVSQGQQQLGCLDAAEGDVGCLRQARRTAAVDLHRR